MAKGKQPKFEEHSYEVKGPATEGTEFLYHFESTSSHGARVRLIWNLPHDVEHADAAVTEPGPHFGTAAFFVHGVQAGKKSVRVLFSIYEEDEWFDHGCLVYWGKSINYRVTIRGKYK